MRIAKLLVGITLAAMNVAHATTLLVGVDPATGESRFFIAPGQGKVQRQSEPGESGTSLYPNQQVSLDNPSDGAQPPTSADLDDLISNTSNAIIEAIIASKAAIDQENAAYIAELQSGGAGQASSQEAIDKINKNLDNLVGNIVKNAISQGKVDEKQIQDVIDRSTTR